MDTAGGTHGEEEVRHPQEGGAGEAVRVWRDRLRLALLYGSPCLAAAITVASLAVEDQPFAGADRVPDIVGLTNAALAAIGSGSGGFMTGRRPGEKIARALLAAAVASVAYMVMSCAGTIAFLVRPGDY